MVPNNTKINRQQSISPALSLAEFIAKFYHLTEKIGSKSYSLPLPLSCGTLHPQLAEQSRYLLMRKNTVGHWRTQSMWKSRQSKRKVSPLARMHLRLERHCHKRKLKHRPPQHQSETVRHQKTPYLQIHVSQSLPSWILNTRIECHIISK